MYKRRHWMEKQRMDTDYLDLVIVVTHLSNEMNVEDDDDDGQVQ